MIDTSRLSFLGSAGLTRLSEAEVVVIGAGGGGSHIVQQLSHLAVGTITVIDPDVLEPSNVNRVVGTTYADVGQFKAALLAQRFDRLGARLIPLIESCTSIDGIAALQHADLSFGAVDSFATRNDIEAICRSSLTPYIDIGLNIELDDDGEVVSAGGQIAASLPTGQCLRCMGIVTDERLAQDRLGYAIAAAPDQQVVSMNGVLASEAVNIALDLLTGYSRRRDASTYISYDALLHSLRPHPLFDASRTCDHFLIENAGWHVILPPRRV